MSVPKAKRKHEANPIVGKSRDVYVYMLKLMSDQQILERSYRPSLAKSITTQAQAIAHCVAIADHIPIFGKNARARKRLNLQLDCIDGIQVLITDLYTLYNIGTISQERIVQAMQRVIDLDRSIREWIKNDRISYDKVLHCKSLDEVGYDDHLEEVPVPETFEEPRQKKDFSEIYENALKTVPEREGIINSPTGPDSPVVDEVREIQKVESDSATVSDVEKLVELKTKKKSKSKDLGDLIDDIVK